MDDYDGAVKLYQDYHDKISFGIHFNLTEGHPLLKSQCLLDTGFYIEKDGNVSFFGKEFNYRKLTKEMKIDIEKELNAQAEKILDSGTLPSHIDSHQHVHWHREIIPIFCKLSAKYGNNKMRKEYITSDNLKLLDFLKSNLRQVYVKFFNPQLKTVDYFIRVKYIYNLITNSIYQPNKTYELMIHPGHREFEYENEISLLKEEPLQLVLNDDKLMNYFEL
jgi:predicted glycoside hydrolase/deacetylase ChbG (UPF0249 family)